MKKHETLFAGLLALSLIGDTVATTLTPLETLIVLGTPPFAVDTNLQRTQLSPISLDRDVLKELGDNKKSSGMAYLDIGSKSINNEVIEKATEIFQSGIPVLLKMNNPTPEQAKKVGTVFGISG